MLSFQWMLEIALACFQIAARGHVGLATTFGSHDVGNPDPRNYCTNQVVTRTDMVVAHPSFPCGSRVLVYNPRTQLSAILTVADRGPRHAAIDIAEGAAAQSIRLNGHERVVFFPISR